jgi:hypothetical protein
LQIANTAEKSFYFQGVGYLSGGGGSVIQWKDVTGDVDNYKDGYYTAPETGNYIVTAGINGTSLNIIIGSGKVVSVNITAAGFTAAPLVIRLQKGETVAAFSSITPTSGLDVANYLTVTSTF